VSRLERIYLQLPVALQNTVVSLEGLRINRRRYGGSFQTVEQLVQTQGAMQDTELQALRIRLLKNHLKTAVQSPFWREQFSNYEVCPEASDPFAELKKLPVLTKEVVKQNVEIIINPTLRRRDFLWRHTSGTTGSGLIFPEILSTEQFTWAFWWRYRRWHGLTRQTRCGYFGGRSVVPIESKRPPFWRWNLAAHQLMLSGYHLSRKTASAYLKALRDYDVQWLHGYPSILSLLAKYVLEDKLRLDLGSLRCITTGAENLSEAQRTCITSAFQVPVVQHYGQAEAVANISECELGQMHVDEDFSAVEIEPNPKGLDSFCLIGTNWLNPAFPLLRYDTADLVLPSKDVCNCGRSGRLIKSIDGRKEDFLVLPNGAFIGRLDHILKDMVNIREAQFLQENLAVVTVRIVPGSSYNKKDEDLLQEEIRQRLGTEIEVRLEYVDAIPRGPNGKLRLVVSNL